jgi:hypothetical protein
MDVKDVKWIAEKVKEAIKEQPNNRCQMAKFK